MKYMQGRPRARWGVRTAITGLAVAAATTAAAAGGAGGSPSAAVEQFSAAIHIRRGILRAGQAGLEPSAPVVSYRLDRQRRGDRWTSVLTTTSPTRPPFVAPSGRDEEVPPAIVRVEDHGDGSPLRFFGPGGEILAPDGRRAAIRGDGPLTVMPGAALLSNPWADSQVPAQALADPAWIDALMPHRAASDSRREALRRRFGRGGTLRGLDRFVAMAPDATTELLADPATGLVVEANVLKAGRLERHTVIQYVGAPGDRLLRRALHDERRLPTNDDLRSVVDLVLDDVRVGEGR